MKKYDIVGLILCRMGYVKIKEAKFNDAKLLLKEAITNDVSETTKINIYLNWGRIYFAEKNFKKADYYLTKALSEASKNGFLYLQQSASDLLYINSKASGNYKKALEMYELNKKLDDKEKLESSSNALLQQQLKYDFEKKELKYQLAMQKEAATKKYWLIGLSGAIVFLLSGGFLYYRNNKQKQAISNLEKNQMRRKLLITQMNPHFIFNSIDNIQNLIYNSKGEDAVRYLTKFSKLTRQILENSNENYILLAEELEMIENYITIQQLLYNNSFTYKLTVDDTLDTEAITLPPMLTQPFIENIIKYNINVVDEKGHLDIGFHFRESKLVFEISCNYEGFDVIKNFESHKSQAIAITRQRLVNYTKKDDLVLNTGKIINNGGNVTGVKVSFEIPFVFEM